MRFILIPAVALALTACAPDPGKVDADIEKFARAYLETSDIAASIGMLDESGSVTSIGGDGKIMRGRDAIKEQANQSAAFLRQITTTAGRPEVMRLGVAHALAIAPFSVSLTALPQITIAEGAATLLVVRRDSGWKVVHEHYSYSALRRP